MSNDKREHTISTKMVGIVQGVGFTHAQFGQQYTTIEGVKYITYFDLSNPKLKGLKPGVRVEHEPKLGPTVFCHSPYVAEELPNAVLLRVAGAL